MIDKLITYFQYPFVRYALIVGILIAFSASLLGVTLVLKRFSFIGDGLSHVAFGALSIGVVLNLTNNMYVVLPITVLSAIILLKTTKGNKIGGDAKIAILSVSSLGVGYLLMNIFMKSPNVSGDICSTLFGSTKILTLSKGEVFLTLGIALVVIIIFVFFYNRIFAVTFDENFSRATGVRADLYNTIISIVTALVIVIAMNLVGSLLISALIVFPALAAMSVFKSFMKVTICAALFAIFTTGLGLIISILMGYPVGATIVVANLLGYLLMSAIGFIRGR